MAPDEIQRALGRIEGTLKGIGEDVAELKVASTSTIKRIDSLELWRAFLAGAWFVSSAVLVYLFKER